MHRKELLNCIARARVSVLFSNELHQKFPPNCKAIISMLPLLIMPMNGELRIIWFSSNSAFLDTLFMRFDMFGFLWTNIFLNTECNTSSVVAQPNNNVLIFIYIFSVSILIPETEISYCVRPHRSAMHYYVTFSISFRVQNCILSMGIGYERLLRYSSLLAA